MGHVSTHAWPSYSLEHTHDLEIPKLCRRKHDLGPHSLAKQVQLADGKMRYFVERGAPRARHAPGRREHANKAKHRVAFRPFVVVPTLHCPPLAPLLNHSPATLVVSNPRQHTRHGIPVRAYKRTRRDRPCPQQGCPRRRSSSSITICAPASCPHSTLNVLIFRVSP